MLKFQYTYQDLPTKALFEELKFRYPNIATEAENLFNLMRLEYSSRDHELAAKDAFIRAYLLGKQTTRIE